MKSIGECRLIVVDYFDSVTSEIDLFIEKELTVTFGDGIKTEELNKKRVVLLNEVKKAEQFNLNNLNGDLVSRLNSSLADDLSMLFPIFCFVFKFEKHISLIVTDSYLTKKQLDLYRGLFDSATTEHGFLSFKIKNETFLSQLFEADFADELVKTITLLHLKINNYLSIIIFKNLGSWNSFRFISKRATRERTCYPIEHGPTVQNKTAIFKWYRSQICEAGCSIFIRQNRAFAYSFELS
jgi:hypothetical protein